MNEHKSGSFASLGNESSLEEDELKTILDVVSNGVVVTNQKKILYVNSGFSRNTGYDLSEMERNGFEILKSGWHNKSFYKSMWKALSTRGRWQGQIWNRHKNGEVYPVHLSIIQLSNSSKQPLFLGIYSEISNLLVKGNIQINLHFRDPSTHMPNRFLLEEKYKEAVAQHKRHVFSSQSLEQIALVYVDINELKQINSQYGYLVGDEVLVHVAKILQRSARSMDTIARYLSDAFIILLPKVKTSEDVYRFSQRVEEELEAGFTIENNLLKPAVSMGASHYPLCSTDYEILLEEAEQAMRLSKKKGQLLTFHCDLEL